MTFFRLITLALSLLASVSVSYAQMKMIPREKIEAVNNPALSPEAASFGFGTRHVVAEPMTEDDGFKTFTYPFENIGEKSLVIDRIVTTCSCATAYSDKKEVGPGESAVITVRYNPAGHPGKFERRIFVYSGGFEDPSAVLKLSVDVTDGMDMSGLWPVRMGSIRLRRPEVTFTEGEKAVEKMRFINLAGKPLALACDEAFLPECLSFRTEPDVVDAGKEGEIVISYDPAAGGSREMMKVILKGLGVPPSQASVTVRLNRLQTEN